jgi:hypothetical protein
VTRRDELTDQGEEERLIIERFRINLYAARAILRRYSPFLDYAARRTSDELLEDLTALVGGITAVSIVVGQLRDLLITHRNV